MHYSVALPVPRSAPFTYRSDEEIAVGSRVLVPLGRRIVTGTVVEGGVPTRDDAKDILEVLDDEPSFSPALLRLTKWISDYYLCSWGEALDAALPTGLTPSSVFYARVIREVTDEEMDAMERRAPRRTELLELLRETTGPLRVDHLQKKLGSSSVAQQLDVLQDMGIVEITTEVEREKGPRTVRAVSFNPDAAADNDSIKNVFDDLDKRAPKQSLVLGHLYVAHRLGEPPIPVQHLATHLGVSTSVIDALVGKGLASVHEVVKESEDDPFDVSLSTRDESTLTLTDEQTTVLHAIMPDLEKGSRREPAVHLINGVTGSGKTVIYQRLMQAVLDKGGSCLMLLPEISLTPQLHDRFKHVFGDRVALLHSRMAVGDRIRTWRRIRNGELRIVIGARSAVFAPLQNVGVIIVDEEHEPSYKQDDPAPRYQGRDVAIMRAFIEACPVVLGTATPSLESLQNTLTSRYKVHYLSHRADDASMPEVRYIDLRQQRKLGNIKGTLSEPLIAAIKERVERKEGVILFLNRRGYAASLQCNDCGAAPECPNCDVTLTWHKASSTLRCHYCGHQEPRHTACQQCGSLELHEIGTGTQRVEEDVRAIFEGTSTVIERMDTDTMKRRGAHRRLLQRFAAGDVDIIIGTQMVAKGLDIPRVTLVGVINADQSLFQNDFRSAERTAQLLTQVAGRAGRSREHPGLVMVQTSNAEHAAISGNYQDFIKDELDERLAAGYPPFSRFIVIEISGKQDQEVEHVSRILDRLLPAKHPCMERFPPVSPSISRIRNRYRRVIAVKNLKQVDPNGSQCRALLSAALRDYTLNHALSTVRVTVDMDASGAV